MSRPSKFPPELRERAVKLCPGPERGKYHSTLPNTDVR